MLEQSTLLSCISVFAKCGYEQSDVGKARFWGHETKLFPFYFVGLWVYGLWVLILCLRIFWIEMVCKRFIFNIENLCQIKWLLKLSQIPEVTEVPQFSKEAQSYLQGLVDGFSTSDALEVKNIEKVTNHDVKAVEYFLKQKCQSHPEIAKVCFASSVS